MPRISFHYFHFSLKRNKHNICCSFFSLPIFKSEQEQQPPPTSMTYNRPNRQPFRQPACLTANKHTTSEAITIKYYLTHALTHKRGIS